RLVSLLIYTPSTVIPIERAVPAMVRTAASRPAAVKSASLVLTISSNRARSILPTVAVLGVPEPLAMPAALRSKYAAGGDFMMKVKDLSLYTVISVGIGRPGSWFEVAALNSLQNAMMFTPF